MNLLEIKLCVVAGLLFTTFGAACLPLVIMLRYMNVDGDPKHRKRSGFLRSIHHMAKFCLPSFSQWNRRKEDLPHTDRNEAVSTTERDEMPTKKSKFPSLMNCFSGGVFLGTSFIALMPEIREIFDEVGIMWPKFYRNVQNSTDGAFDEKTDGTTMPITEILVTCGLFLILCVEQVVHSLTDHNKHAEEKSSDHTNTEENVEVCINGVNGSKANIKVSMSTLNGDKLESEIVVKDVLVVDGENHADENNILLHDKSEETRQEVHHDDSKVRSVILVSILSLHSLLEGLAIGLQTKASSTLSIFVAVVFHKSLMAFSMGNNLVQSGSSSKSLLVAAVIFAVMSPIGIIVGIIMKETKSGTEIIHGVLQGIATGTFLFITFFEVLSKEFSNHFYRISKTIAFILGYGCILAVMFAQHGA